MTRDLVAELHPQRRPSRPVSLDSRLDRDLGLDSLGRAELMLRLEQAFKVRLRERLLVEAGTPRDLLIAILEAGPSEAALTEAEVRHRAPEIVEGAPVEAQTLIEVLDWHVSAHPERVHARLPRRTGDEIAITYRGLAETARAVARGLRRRGLGAGGRVAIMLPTSAAFFEAFFGTLYAGGIPVPIYPPMRLSQLEEHLHRQAGILRNCGAAFLIAMPEAAPFANLLRATVDTLHAVETVDSLLSAEPVELPARLRPDDIALLQYTSGSTGDPKGVILSHANILSNIRAMGQAMVASSADVTVSWLPLYHDMGLIGVWLGSLYFAASAVVLSPIDFIVRPELWLWTIHRYRATISAAPNFAFELCLSQIEEETLKGLDLSSLRILGNGAEPISPSTVRRFIDRFAAYGLRTDAMAPAYGLAENSVDLTFPLAGRGSVTDRIRRESLARWGEAVPAGPDEHDVLEFIACGQPLPGNQIRIVDATGHEVGERHEGHLEFRGPSATRGYFRNEKKTRELFDGDWLTSGDLAYIAEGDVFITGRSKDIIIRAGQNIYPHEIEDAVGDVAGVRKGCVAAFSSADPASGTERIVLVAETHDTSEEAQQILRQRIGEIVIDLLGLPADEIILVPPNNVPKTASGKIRRAAARERYEAGKLSERPRALWLQVLRLKLAGLLPLTRRRLRAGAEILYAGYWWLVVGLLAATAWAQVLLLPGRSRRWTAVRHVARLALRLVGARPSVSGEGNLPADGAVLVSNHASYIDGLILSAVLPGTPVFVAKKELAAQLFAGRFLDRLGTFFVERDEGESGLLETDRAVALASAGHTLVFFAEGTISRMPGLLEFRLGAFMTAVRAGKPIVPIVMRGTRSMLRSGQWFPRRAAISVQIAEPLKPDGRDFTAAVRLRDAARQEVLAHCGEPDLSHEVVRPPRPNVM